MLSEAVQKINRLGKERIPFLFIVDYNMQEPLIIPLADVKPEKILYSVNRKTNAPEFVPVKKKPVLNARPVSYEKYSEAFQFVQQHIRHGNSFLLNLTFPSRVETGLELKEIFHISKARYKLWFRDRFVVFSPETFVQIKGREIRSFPMKGTMDATLPDAENRLLNSEKELAEHYTIVDLIRNDLSMVAKKVKVEKFRNIEKIKTHRGELLQMSSVITGILPENYREHLGDILFKLLPAGSICGAPKQKTLEIIRETEQYDRGYYTGIFGIFDGENLDSGVMIRFIEKTNDGLVYKSGGGITAKSNCDEEYRELMDKIYIPV